MFDSAIANWRQHRAHSVLIFGRQAQCLPVVSLAPRYHRLLDHQCCGRPIQIPFTKGIKEGSQIGLPKFHTRT